MAGVLGPGRPSDDVKGNKKLESALWFAKQGFYVHPLQPMSKRPILNGWRDMATTDPDVIIRWWKEYPDANPAINIRPEQNILVVDVDTKNGGDKTFGLLNELVTFPPTLTVRTPSGGLHLYYKYPSSRVRAKDLLGKLGPGIDVLINRSVVVPYAERIDGEYTFGAWDQKRREAYEDKDGARDVAHAPGWLVDLLNGEKWYELAAPVEKGDRNNAINLHGFTLRHHRGVKDEETIRAAMLLAGLNSCEPPYPGDDKEMRELRGTIGSVMSSELEPEREQHEEDSLEAVLQYAPFTDEGNLQRLRKWMEDKGKRLKYWKDGPSRRRWYRWNGNIWEPTDQNAIQREAILISHEIISIADWRIQRARVAKKKDNAAIKLRKWGLQLQNQSMINRLIKQAEGDDTLEFKREDLDRDPFLVAAQNCTLDLGPNPTRVYKESDPGYYITKQLGTSYVPDAKCPMWEKFVLDIMSGDEEMARYLQRAVGYTLTGSTREEALFMLVGRGANGKSVFLRVIGALMGDYGTTASFDTFDYQKHGSIPNDLAALRGARFVASSEREEGKALAEGRVKSVTGADEITARHLYGEFFTFKPTFKIWLAMNHLPRVVGDDDGIWRRIRVIDFRESFLGREDKTLGEKLLTELPGILNWALEGLQEWHRIGLSEPQRVRDNVANYRAEMDTLHGFLRDAVEFTGNRNDSISGDDLYRRYRSWMKANGYFPKNKGQFTHSLKAKLAAQADIPKDVHYRSGGKTRWRYFVLKDFDDVLAEVMEEDDDDLYSIEGLLAGEK